MRPAPQLIALALLMGCPEPWRAEEALAPSFARLDQDADGALDQRELQRGSPAPVSVAELDADGDEAVGPDELLVAFRELDPAGFDGVLTAVAPSPADVELFFPEPPRERRVRVMFEFMVAQVRQIAPQTPLPSEQDLQAAAATGSLDSPEAQAVAQQLAQAYQGLGLTVPPSVAARTGQRASQPPRP